MFELNFCFESIKQLESESDIAYQKAPHEQLDRLIHTTVCHHDVLSVEKDFL